MKSIEKGPEMNQTKLQLYLTDSIKNDKCDIDKIKHLYKKMAYSNKNANVKFAREMGSIYHVRQVSIFFILTDGF